jgi:hypothetical protein
MPSFFMIDHSSLQTYIDQSNVLSKRVEQLEKENTLLKEKCLKMTEESNMEKFKCQLLVEMVCDLYVFI